MTVESLRRTEALAPSYQDALSIIDAYRDEFKDRTSLHPLEMEFPYMQVEDKGSVYLLETGDNLAGAFKWRGALVAATALQKAGHERIVAASAGNHGRGMVLVGKTLGMMTDIVVPSSAPYPKREGMRELGSKLLTTVHVHGNTFEESLAYAYEFAHTRGAALIHPYDDKHVIRGQGTIVDDIFRAREDVSHIVVPVGGGGLLAGILDRLKELGRDDMYVTGVEAPGSNSLSRSLYERNVTAAEAPNHLYGGSAVRFVGQRALQSALRYANLQVVTAEASDITYVTDSYQQAREDLMRTEKYFVPAYEPTSIVAVAGLYKAALVHGEATVVVGTGHNAPLVK